jgi:hypothetical protein
MSRDYRRELRERGVVLPGMGTSPGCMVWNAWVVLDDRQKRAFCRRAGLMPIPPSPHPGSDQAVEAELRAEIADLTHHLEESPQDEP